MAWSTKTEDKRSFETNVEIKQFCIAERYDKTDIVYRYRLEHTEYVAKTCTIRLNKILKN